MDKIKVGVVGCGKISKVYLTTMREVYGNILDVAACADLDVERAKASAAEQPGVKPMSVGRLLADPEIRIVVNLTIPKAHAPVAMRALRAGKNVYGEKPLALTRAQGRRMLELAKEKGLLIGNAPDTFLGGGIQTCLKLVNDGVIGQPVAATAFMMGHGHESWHPDPEFYYQVGGGPMFDMGPYYLTALVSLLGPVQRVAGMTKTTFPTRTITSEKKRGTVIPVEIPTHVTGLLEFAGGAVGTLVMSFDVWGHTLPRIEIHGTEGSLQVPDPNTFGGVVKLKKPGEKEWQEIPLTHVGDIQRGTGVADMALSLAKPGRPHRANGEVAYHVLDIMHAVHEASDRRKHVELKSTCTRPAAVPPGLPKGMLDA